LRRQQSLCSVPLFDSIPSADVADWHTDIQILIVV
jgi:hypothetical protein